jgi:RHS repeat-associated protein
MGRLIGTTTNYSFLTGTTFTNAYTYNANSNRTGYTAPDGSTNTYTYDTLSRLTTLANSWAGSFNFTYDSLNRPTQMTRPNGVNTNYTYDSLSRLLSVLHQNGASTIDGATYTVDATGNRTSKRDQMAGVTSNYAYDAIKELTQVTQAAHTTESYTYDSVGNRLSSLAAATSSYNASNQLTSNSNATYSYDANGNTTSKTDSTGTTGYTWDFENRLMSVALPGVRGTASFKYDPLGRRIQKVFGQNTTAVTTNYFYDHDNVIGTVNQNGNVLARYAQGSGIDEPLAESNAGTTGYYERDGLGSVTSLTDATGAIAQTYAYDSFGNVINTTGTLANPFLYTGRDFDSETGLYYYRARYYDPSGGRFVSEDPVRSPIHPNRYKYVRNSPLNRVDTSGMNDHYYPKRGCTLVGTVRTLLWTTETGRTPSSGWSFLMSHQAGPEAPFAPWAVIDCVWQRTYTAELWGHVLVHYKYECWNDCVLGHFTHTEDRFSWQVEDLGKTTGKDAPARTQFISYGAEDETNDLRCVTDPKLRQGG